MRHPPTTSLALAAGICVAVWDAAQVHDQTVQRADPGTLLFIGAIALSIAAGYLLRPKVPAAQRDNRPASLSTRGKQLAYVLGRRIVGGEAMWVGNRTSREVKVGGKGFGSKGGKQIEYFEDAAHSICLGPASALHQILANQINILLEPISPDTHPSGTLVTCSDGNSFYMYWGHKKQPVNTRLADPTRLGVASRWPYWVYIEWVQRNLGNSATWPQLDYDIECTCVGFELPGSDCNFLESAADLKDTGINGAHGIYQLATANYPHGIGQDPAEWDFGVLKALGVLIQTERIPQNLLIAEGTSFPDILEDILTDISVMLATEQGLLVLMPIRPVASPPTLDDRVVVIPRPSFEVLHGDTLDDRVVFIYPDRSQLFRGTDITTDDDATARAWRRKRPQTLQMPTITDILTAAKVVDRRKLIYVTDQNKLSFTVSRTARKLVPGQVVIVPTIGTIRVTGVQKNSTSRRTVIDASLNQYDLDGSGWLPTQPNVYDNNASAAADDFDMPIEIPHDYAGFALRIGVVRGRTTDSAVSAKIWASTNGTSYYQVGEQVLSAVGASLLESLPATDDALLEVGPLMSSASSAMSRAQDLSGDQNAWCSGQQIMLIKNEIMFIESVSAVTGGYRANNVLRGRSDTWQEDHDIGEHVAIFAPSSVAVLASSQWSVGQTLSIKVQPEGADLDDITPITLTLTGRALGPPPIDNFSPMSYGVAEDIVFTWTDRIRYGTSAGAGELGYGEPIATTPAIEGTFTIEVYNGLMQLRRTTSVGVLTWTYTDTMRTTDLIGDDAFFLKITPMLSGFGGRGRIFRITGATL